MIDLVLFDLDDTLHDDTQACLLAGMEAAEEVARERNIDARRLADAYAREAARFWHGISPEQLRTKLAHLRESMWERALAELGIVDPALARRTAERYYLLRKKYFVLFPGALELLEEQRSRGRRLGILTNGFAETHVEKIALLGLAEAVDGTFFADDTGLLKPDPAFFQHACERLGVPAKHAAMVGDRYDRDIAGALAAGMTAIWLNVRGERLPADAPPPHATVTAFSGVGRALETAAARSRNG
uniref:Putative enzyme n=1 Tax=mine drainage metagenome TaxID=410659 RepID=E6PEN7_9ZZZZ